MKQEELNLKLQRGLILEMGKRVEILVEDAKKLLNENSEREIKFELNDREYKKFSGLKLFFEGYNVSKKVKLDVMGDDSVRRTYYISLTKEKK